MSDQEHFESLWRSSAYEAVPYTDDFPECFLVLPELIDGSISQGKSTSIKIHITLHDEKGILQVIDNGKGISNPLRLLHWSSVHSSDITHRYGHGSKKCLTKWNKNYRSKWYIRYRTCDKKQRSGSLFTYKGPFEGIKKQFDEDEENEDILLPSGVEWYIEFEKETLHGITDPKDIMTTVKEIIRTRYAKCYFDRIQFEIKVTEHDEEIIDISIPITKQWKTLQECVEDEIEKTNGIKVKTIVEPFNGITLSYTKYKLTVEGRTSFTLKKEFPLYGQKSMNATRIHVALNGRTIEHMHYWKCLDRSQHNSLNGIIGFVNFEGLDSDYEKMPTPCTTKVSFYESCPIFRKFKQKFLEVDIEESIVNVSEQNPIENKSQSEHIKQDVDMDTFPLHIENKSFESSIILEQKQDQEQKQDKILEKKQDQKQSDIQKHIAAPIDKKEKVTLVKESNVIKNDPKDLHFIYLFEKIDANTNVPVYKFGKTNRDVIERLKEHCLTSKVLLLMQVVDCSTTEKEILKLLKKNPEIKQVKHMGREYFECADPSIMIKIILSNCYE
jgi:hypothetical protein